MKKIVISMVSFAMLICICACGKNNIEKSELTRLTDEEQFLETDNSTDTYSRTYFERIETKMSENTKLGRTSESVSIGKNIICIDETYYDAKEEEWFKNFVRVNPRQGMAEENYNVDDLKLAISNSGKSDSYYIEIRDENMERGLQFYEEDGTLSETVLLDFLPHCSEIGTLWNYAVDFEQNIHVVQADKNGEGYYYNIVSKSREILLTDYFDDIWFYGFKCLPDGTVVYDCIEKEASENDRTLWVYTFKNSIDGTCKKEITKRNINDGKEIIEYAFLPDGRIVYANSDGLFICNIDFAEEEIIYKWSNHGMTSSDIKSLSCDAQGIIKLIKLDRSNNSYVYYELEPTEKDVEVLQIEIAVTPKNENKIRRIVTEFNKENPSSVISVNSEYENTNLLTKLVAKDGPVLIDTDLIGFSEQKKLWMKLDDDLKGVLNDINPYAIKLGSIDGEVYGIVTDYYVQTLASKKAESTWTYKQFVECAKENSIKYLFYDKYNDFSTVLDFFGTSEKNSYFLDDTGRLIFYTQEFDSLLNILDKHHKNYFSGLVDSTLDNTIYQRLSIRTPGQFYILKQSLDKNVKFVGFPSSTASYNRLISNSRFAVRDSASEKEKALALRFVEYMLSYNSQKMMSEDINFSISVRNDFLEKQIEEVNKGYVVVMDSEMGDQLIENDVDTSIFKNDFYEFLSAAIPLECDNSDFMDILTDEFNDYFNGYITKDMLKENLEGRIGIYLAEKGD